MKKGFTLVEVMVVVGIIALLAGLAIPGFLGSLARARAAEGITVLSAVHKAAMRYLDATGNIGTGVADLDITMPATYKNFCPPGVYNSTAAITYNGPGAPYTLYATCKAGLRCGQSAGDACPQGITRGDFGSDTCGAAGTEKSSIESQTGCSFLD